jgi:hypothetical protein
MMTMLFTVLVTILVIDAVIIIILMLLLRKFLTTQVRISHGSHSPSKLTSHFAQAAPIVCDGGLHLAHSIVRAVGFCCGCV